MPNTSTERRFYPRISARFPVSVRITVNGEEHTIEASAADISMVAIQVRGDGEMIRHFQRQESLPRVCTLELSLPGHDETLVVASQLLNYRRLSQHLYAIALSISGMKADDREKVKAYIAAQL